MAAACIECNAPLVKQYVTRDGRALTKAEAAAFARYQDAEARTLECSSCANPCFQSKRDSIKHGYIKDGTGECRPCGGPFATHGKTIMAIRRNSKHRNLAKIWSCPTHGIL